MRVALRAQGPRSTTVVLEFDTSQATDEPICVRMTSLGKTVFVISGRLRVKARRDAAPGGPIQTRGIVKITHVVPSGKGRALSLKAISGIATVAARDLRDYAMTKDGCRVDAAQLAAERPVLIFGGKRDSNFRFGDLDKYVDLLIKWHQRGGRAIFLANALPESWSYFAKQAGVELAKREPGEVASQVTIVLPVGDLAAGATIPIAPSKCAPGWEGTANVVPSTPQGPYCLGGNRVAFIEAGAPESDDVEPRLTPAELQFLEQLVIDMTA